MSYPTLEQYNEAFQHPGLALVDPELKTGSIATTGLGLPLALCGGFALTYTIKNGAKKHAVRCFHKQSNALEQRYIAISKRLKNLNSPYFVDFEFQPKGVRVAGNAYPIVKMAWASGTTLGEFLESNYKNSSNLNSLASSLRALSKYLESQKMAHGDIQPGNVMVSDGGKKLQLIDYDGMFLEDLKTLGSAELGHRNFQHPKRVTNSWDTSLDRFSFISLDLSIRALAAHPDLWTKTHSDGDAVLFKANDFADPANSSIFSDLTGRSVFAEEAKNFAAICRAGFNQVPTIDDFLNKKNIPQVTISIPKRPETSAAKYLSAFPVVDATKYSMCIGFVGDKVELVGRIVEVKRDKTRHGKPYVFINFGPWQGHIVKISIWSEGLATMSNPPTENWVGKWVSVVGLVEPPYVNKRYKYSHLSITVTQSNQIHVITENEAKFRLSGSATRTAFVETSTSNKDILDSIKGNKSIRITNTPTSKVTSPITAKKPATGNQAILDKIREKQISQLPPRQRRGAYSGGPINQIPTKSTPSTSNSKCFIASAVYGVDSKETAKLRQWRDKTLERYILGRCFIAIYYFVSPHIVPIILKHKSIQFSIKRLLDKLLKKID